MTEFQERMLASLRRCPNGQASITSLAGRMNSSRVGVWQSALSLVKAGMVVTFPADDSIGAVHIVALTRAAREAHPKEC